MSGNASFLCKLSRRNLLGLGAQSVARLTPEPEVPGSIPVGPHTFVSLFADARKVVVSYWRKYVHEVLLNHLGRLRHPRRSAVRFTDSPDMTIAGCRGLKAETNLDSEHEFTVISSYYSFKIV